MASKDIDWNDLRYVLVLAQHQTMVAAAEALRVHQTTISRRILALEERLKTRLFDRIDGRFAPTSRGMVVVRRAQEMESVGQALDGDLTHNPAHGRAVVVLATLNLVSSDAAMTAKPTTPIMMLQTAFISGFTPSRTSE